MRLSGNSQAATPLQVVSLKMCLHSDIVERLNKELPPAIRVFGYRRVTNGFDARKLCDRYNRAFPTSSDGFLQHLLGGDVSASRAALPMAGWFADRVHTPHMQAAV